MNVLNGMIAAALLLTGCGGLGAEQLHGRWVEIVPADPRGTYAQRAYARDGIAGGTFTYVVSAQDITWFAEPAVEFVDAVEGPWRYEVEGSRNRFVLLVKKNAQTTFRIIVVLIDAHTAAIYMRDPERPGETWGPFIVRRSESRVLQRALHQRAQR